LVVSETFVICMMSIKGKTRPVAGNGL
jgi:hypothetical protein